jgi:hypothetical protein
MRFRDGSDKATASNYVQISKKNWDEDPGNNYVIIWGRIAWAVHVKSNLIETGKGEINEEQSQEHVHHFLWYQADWSLIILPGSPKSFAHYCDVLLRLRKDMRSVAGRQVSLPQSRIEPRTSISMTSILLNELYLRLEYKLKKFLLLIKHCDMKTNKENFLNLGKRGMNEQFHASVALTPGKEGPACNT